LEVKAEVLLLSQRVEVGLRAVHGVDEEGILQGICDLEGEHMLLRGAYLLGMHLKLDVERLVEFFSIMAFDPNENLLVEEVVFKLKGLLGGMMVISPSTHIQRIL